MLYEPGGGQLLQSYNTATGADTRFAWSGGRMTAEINASGWAITRRYVPGPGVDETVVWYEGSGTSDRRWRSEEHTSELQSRPHLVCRRLLAKKKGERQGRRAP